MPPRRILPAEPPPDLPTEKAYSILKNQLNKLQDLKGRNHQESSSAEDEWFNLTSKLIMRSFGRGSPNVSNFSAGSSAGSYFISPFGGGPNNAQDQRNFESRLAAYESALRSSIAELELDLPDVTMKGVYEPGEEYEYYRDVTACLRLAQKEIFVIDPYLSTDIFDVYATAISRSIGFRLLSANVRPDVSALAQKYATGGNFALRSSTAIHDRVIFVDRRVWVSGQSLKDAATKKPTYIVEHAEPLMRDIYEKIWSVGDVLF